MNLRLGLALLGGLAACAPSLVERRVDELRGIVAEAQRRGAGSCAPVELALSSVHLEFAQLELREGDEPRAERHLIVAEPNGKAALRRTKEGDCQASSQSAAVDLPARIRTENTSRPSKVAAAPGHKRAER
jgi:hypothetical protein